MGLSKTIKSSMMAASAVLLLSNGVDATNKKSIAQSMASEFTLESSATNHKLDLNEDLKHSEVFEMKRMNNYMNLQKRRLEADDYMMISSTSNNLNKEDK